MYKKVSDNVLFGEAKSVIRVKDTASIPFDPANTDYVEYLKWLDEGNTPEPADEITNE